MVKLCGCGLCFRVRPMLLPHQPSCEEGAGQSLCPRGPARSHSCGRVPAAHLLQASLSSSLTRDRCPLDLPLIVSANSSFRTGRFGWERRSVVLKHDTRNRNDGDFLQSEIRLQQSQHQHGTTPRSNIQTRTDTSVLFEETLCKKLICLQRDPSFFSFLLLT